MQGGALWWHQGEFLPTHGTPHPSGIVCYPLMVTRQKTLSVPMRGNLLVGVSSSVPLVTIQAWWLCWGPRGDAQAPIQVPVEEKGGVSAGEGKTRLVGVK